MDSIKEKFESRLDIPKTLESIRLEVQLTKSEFSKKCKIKPSFYSEVIHGKRSIKMDTLEKICEQLEIPLDVFIFKSLRENTIKDPKQKRLIREIRPLMNEIASELYLKKADLSYS
tara:strand:- start:121815 stop:122162 length:348 start_codon:yes stop_codon:yes gene_type:complete